MWWLGSQLCKIGFPVQYFNYSTTRVPFKDSVQRLAHKVDELNGEVNLVGHSLGGLLAVAAAQHTKHGGKIVALGSPFQGSRAAAWLTKTPMGPFMLGTCQELLGQQFQVPIHSNWRVGVLVGTKPFGLGFITGKLSGDHDGTVMAEETELQGAERVFIPTTHTNMIWSRESVHQIGNFLKMGTFITKNQ